MVDDPLESDESGAQDVDDDGTTDSALRAGYRDRVAGAAHETKERVGYVTGSAIGTLSLLLLAGWGKFLKALLRALPGSKYIFKKLIHGALHGYHQNTSGDRVGIEFTPDGRAHIHSVKWRGNESLDRDERPGWKSNRVDKTWEPSSLGATEGATLGKTPIIPLDSESWRGTSVIESRVAEAVDMGDMRPLYDVEEAVLHADVEYVGGASGPAGQQPMADGGNLQLNGRDFNPKTHPLFEDMLIDIGAGEGFDGQAVSFTKFRDIALEQTTTEEMRMQEERGFLAGRSKEDWKRFAIKALLIGGAVAIMGLIGPELINALFNQGGGGGGGSVIPI